MKQNYKFFPNPATGTISDDDTKRYFSRIGFAVCGLLLVSSVFSTLLAYLYYFIAQTFVPAILENSVYYAIITNLISLFSIYAIGLPMFLAIAKPLPKIKPYKAKMKFSECLGGLCIALLLLAIGSYISSIILIYIESMLKITTTNPVESMTSVGNTITTIVFVCIITPILEELLFRKLLCDRLLPLGEGYAIFVSATIFGLIHGNFYQFAYAFILGLFFAFIYVKTGKLIYSTVYHIIINFIGTVVASWITGMVDIEKLTQIVESGILDMNDPATAALMNSLYIILAYEAVLIACYVIGFVLIFKAKKKKLLSLESGILPTPKQHKFANIFMTSGVAAAIALFVFTFISSLLI